MVKRVCLTLEMMWEQQKQQQQFVPLEERPSKLSRYVYNHRRGLRYPPCSKAKATHQKLQSWCTELQQPVCLWCYPHLANARGKLILSWLHEDTRKIIEDLLAQGEVIPGPWEEGKEYDEER